MFETQLMVKDVESSLVALQYDVGGEAFATFNIRNAYSTASASVTNGTPTSLQAGVSGRYMDLKYITLANNSTVAVSVDLTDDSTTAETFQVPANDTTEIKFDPPLPQGTVGSAWRLDMPDITGTTISAYALFRINRP